METSETPSTRTAFLQWMATAGLGLLVFFAASAAFVGALWLLTELVGDEHREIQIAAAFVFGLAFLFSIVSSMVAAFAALRLASAQNALGLPEGSIRAIIALVLVVIFVIMAVYLVETVFTEETTTEEAQSAATQLLATIGTLVAAVAAFYFGSSAVTTGATAVAQAATAGRAARPTAITKGSALREEVYWLVGIVNPNGLETNWYFQYGPDRTYGQQTKIAPLGAGDAETMVEIDAADVEYDWHFRIVAFSEAGTSYGDDAVVTDARPDAEPPEGGVPGPEGGESPPEGEDQPPPEGEDAIAEEEQAIAAEEEAVAESEGEVGEGEEAVAQAEAEIAEVEEQVAETEEAIAEGEEEIAEGEKQPPERKRRSRRRS